MDYSNEKSYADFFKEELYEGFVQHLLDKYGARHVIHVLRDKPLISKRNVHYSFMKDFSEFLEANPKVAKIFAESRHKLMGLRNIAGGELRFPVDTTDDWLLVTERVRQDSPLISTSIIPGDFPRATAEHKKAVKTFKGTPLKGTNGERKYLHPKRLTVHLKDGFARSIGKTTLSFMIESRSDAMDIILNRYEKKVAFARIQNEEEFAFVKRRNKKRQ